MIQETPALTAAFGAAARAMRVERRYSQEGFTAHADMDRSYSGAVERGAWSASLSALSEDR